MQLELEKLKDFLREVPEGEMIRLAELQTIMQDEKGQPIIGMMAVLTCRVGTYIVKYVETIGTAHQDNEGEYQALLNYRKQKVDEIKKAITGMNLPFNNGVWSNV